MTRPDYEQFRQDAQSFTVIPLHRRLDADFETPLSVFLKCRGMFLLESVERGEHVGRYSIIACGKRAEITIRDQTITIRKPGEKASRKQMDHDCLDELKAFFNPLNTPEYDGLPPFFGGAIGFLGYEAVQYMEKIPVKANESPVPDVLMVIPELLAVVDSVQHTVHLIVPVFTGKDPRAEYTEALALLEEYQDRLAGPLPAFPGNRAPAPPRLLPLSRRTDFMEKVRQAKELIRKGEIIQLVLSQCFRATLDTHPFSLYQALRSINPSPYLFYLNTEDYTLVGSSPEVMVKMQNRELLIKPIAGTRPRGKSLIEDDRLARELRSDQKEQAEHLMLVDLARNDLGRVAAPGSVEVKEYMAIERYSHVMHLVSSVTATLAESCDAFDVIRAVFPAGTLSGAPKIRAMQLIAELEERRRGVYGGMVFYLGFNGNLDSCITIRTILQLDKEAYIQAGAGIVADSDPETEYHETINKARALFSAISRASRGE